MTSRTKLKVFGLLIAIWLAPALARAATVSLSPAAGNFNVSQTFSAGIIVSTPDTAMNAVSGTLVFPADLLEVTSLSKSASIVNLWVQEPSFSNTAGTISFEGVALNPGFTGGAGRVLGINFRAKRPGTANLSFQTPAVLANDGEGTDILSSAGTARWQLLLSSTSPAPAPVTKESKESKESLSISSPSHPDQDKWYRGKTAKFAWNLPADARAVRVLLDQNAASAPNVLYDPAIDEREVTDLPEGVSYFHAQVKTKIGWGGAGHFRVQIDTTPPDRLKMSELPRADETEAKVKIRFDSNDALSGIDHYEIRVGNETPAVWRGGPDEIYELFDPLPVGTHVITARAFDRAGNSLASSITVVVTPPPSAWWRWGEKLLAAFSLAVPLLAIIILLAIMLERSHRRFRAWRRRIKKEVDEAEESIGRAFDLIREDLEKQLVLLERAKSKRELTREESRILTRVRKNLRAAEKYIKKEIEDIEKEVK